LPARKIIHNQNQLMVVIAVQDFDVHAGLGHSAREQAELAGDILLQPLNDDVPFCEDADAGRFEGTSGGRAINEEKVGDASAVNHPRSAALDTETGAAQGLAHLGESAGAILQ
jgi:hypothetical protein